MKQISVTELSHYKVLYNPTSGREIDAAVALGEQVSKFYPTNVLVSMSEVKDHPGTFVYEYTDVYIVHPLKIRISKDWKGKYQIFAWAMHGLKHVSQNRKDQASRSIGEPQQIGVLTKNKISQWITHWEQVYAALKTENDAAASRIQAFRDSLKGLPVHWHGTEQTRGAIEMGGLQFDFHIEDTMVSTWIKVTAISSLETFLKMSDNKLYKNETLSSTSNS